jgi:hypothetical protein
MELLTKKFEQNQALDTPNSGNWHTLAIRLVLRYCIMCFHPAINAIPNTIPKKSPEISPILLFQIPTTNNFLINN